MSACNDACIQVPELLWRAEYFHVGQVVSFDESVYDAKSAGGSDKVRREGKIVELWVEPWRDTMLAYAEVDIDGREHRTWFHRDHVGSPGELGVAPADALF